MGFTADVVTGKIDERHLAPLQGNENLEETAEALESLKDVIAADVTDDDEEEEEDVNESG